MLCLRVQQEKSCCSLPSLPPIYSCPFKVLILQSLWFPSAEMPLIRLSLLLCIKVGMTAKLWHLLKLGLPLPLHQSKQYILDLIMSSYCFKVSEAPLPSEESPHALVWHIRPSMEPAHLLLLPVVVPCPRSPCLTAAILVDLSTPSLLPASENAKPSFLTAWLTFAHLSRFNPKVSFSLKRLPSSTQSTSNMSLIQDIFFNYCIFTVSTLPPQLSRDKG
jgi:hypothetical protein